MDLVKFFELYWFEAVFGVVALSMIYQIIRNGGLKNALFGAKRTAEIGSVDARKRFGVKSSLAVYRMKDSDPGEDVVGIAFVAKGFLSYNMQPISLTKRNAVELAKLLDKASGENTKAR